MENKSFVAVGSTFIVVGAVVVLFSMLYDFDPFFLIIGGLLIIVPLVFIVRYFKHSIAVDEQTYEWYKNKYPSNVQGKIVTCSTCENNLIEERKPLHDTFQRETYCTQCGKTLFYSAE